MAVEPADRLNANHESLRRLLRGYLRALLIALGIMPSLAIFYIHWFQNPALVFVDEPIHVIAIGVAIAVSAFVTYVTWHCYRHTGEPFLRWLTLGFLGFTLIYAPHGALTHYADDNLWLFILYGPASRLVMAACLLIGLLNYGKPAEPLSQRERKLYWWMWIGAFALIDLLLALLALSPLAPTPWLRMSLEIGAACLALVSVAVMAARRIRSPLMTIYALSLAYFAQSSLGFVMALPWNHQWWLAHFTFAAGFLLLSFGVVQAYMTTRSFSKVYSQVELMERLVMEKSRAEEALNELRHVHQELVRLAATDPLTGAANRREFLDRAAAEVARAKRAGSPLSILMIDLDHFKRVNDVHGHQVGDKALKAFVNNAMKILRPSDLLGRIGGEEFAVLLLDSTREAAQAAAERIRREVERDVVIAPGARVHVTVSIGVAQLGVDGDSLQACSSVADARLYQAKQKGRNRVVAF